MTGPLLAELPPHALAAFQSDTDAALAATGVSRASVIDLGLGDAAEPVPSVIRDALLAGVEATTRYPPTAGLPELRAAIAGWTERRLGARLDPATQIQPTQGSKEAVFALAQVVRTPGRDLVAVTTPGYAIPERGARVAGLEVAEVVRRPEDDFAYDVGALDSLPADRLAIVWITTPDNPTGAVASRDLLRELGDRARREGWILAVDEAYTELWFDQPPASALESHELRNVVVFHSLSKRSGLTGYRSGFMAGDPKLIALARKYRAMAGTAPTEFVQRAAIVAWSDERHVDTRRSALAAKRAALLEALARAELHVAASEAGLFLWTQAPGGDADGFARALLERGVLVVPGRYFGAGGDGWFRLALVPSLEVCEEAGRTIEEVASRWTS